MREPAFQLDPTKLEFSTMSVMAGLEVLLTERLNLLRGRRIGLIAHPASIDRHFRHAVELLHGHPDLQLTKIFGPQHGARGETQDNMIEWSDYRDPQTGLPVFSLYGEARKPTAEMLEDVDVLVIDLQDVGARYYTFIYTMALAMEACADAGLEVVVTDRPNPIGGNQIEGPVLDKKFSSFVGLYPLAIRHGMTIGELALYFNSQISKRCNLTVVPMKGWTRDQYFRDTELPWVLPSPNIPRPETTLVYPGTCLLEGTNVSEGRGTTLPFELCGAPWISPPQLKEGLEAAALPGVTFRCLHFQPTFHKWTGHLLGGIQIHVTDSDAFEPLLTALTLVQLFRDLGQKHFQWKAPPYEYEYQLLPFDILCGTDLIRKGLEAGSPAGSLPELWSSELNRFAKTRTDYLLY